MEESKNNDIILFLVAGMAVLFILAVSIVVFFRLYKKKIIKQQAKIFEQEKKHQQDLLYSNIQSVEAERKRIAKDIHDELGSIFSTLSLQLRKPKNTEPVAPTDEQLASSQQLIEAGLKTVRRIAHEMMPPELVLFGLEKALENLAARINVAGGTQAFVDYHVADKAFNEEQSLALYRIAQEMISNTVKHAQASEITIEVYEKDGARYFRYTDDGKGIPPNVQKTGMGMKNIESRAGMIGAAVVPETPPVKGYRCTIKIPVS